MLFWALAEMTDAVFSCIGTEVRCHLVKHQMIIIIKHRIMLLCYSCKMMLNQQGKKNVFKLTDCQRTPSLFQSVLQLPPLPRTFSLLTHSDWKQNDFRHLS